MVEQMFPSGTSPFCRWSLLMAGVSEVAGGQRVLETRSGVRFQVSLRERNYIALQLKELTVSDVAIRRGFQKGRARRVAHHPENVERTRPGAERAFTELKLIDGEQPSAFHAKY